MEFFIAPQRRATHAKGMTQRARSCRSLCGPRYFTICTAVYGEAIKGLKAPTRPLPISIAGTKWKSALGSTSQSALRASSQRERSPVDRATWRAALFTRLLKYANGLYGIDGAAHVGEQRTKKCSAARSHFCYRGPIFSQGLAGNHSRQAS